MIEAAFRRYLALFEEITPDRLAELDALVAPDVVFRDPFNHVSGRAAMRRIFARMFEALREPRFVIAHAALAGHVGLVSWRLSARAHRNDDPIAIVGMSEVHFDEAGRVTAHLDHWDAAGQVYARLPVLGFVLRRLARRLGAG